MGKRKIDENKYGYAKYLHHQGMNNTKIAERLGVSGSVISYLVKTNSWQEWLDYLAASLVRLRASQARRKAALSVDKVPNEIEPTPLVPSDEASIAFQLKRIADAFEAFVNEVQT